MTINITQPTNEQLKPRITVIGVGGAGCNAVNNMIDAHLEGVEFLVANTDAQSLANSLAERKVQLGAELTKGLGAGAKPEIGRQAADESLTNVLDQLEGTHMLFVTAGMGGGTGTGAAPVIAEAARERGILTVGVVTKPFEYEGVRRMKIAEDGIKDLTESVDTLIIIPNQNLFRIANKDTTFSEAFKMADEVLYNGVKGVTDLIVKQGRINLDFADIQTVMLEMGKAMMGTGEAEGDERAIKAAEIAISNPLLDDTSIANAKGVIINISGGEDVKLYEIDEIAAHVKKQCKENVNLIVGNTIEKIEDGKIRVSLLASGIGAQGSLQESQDQEAESFKKPRLVAGKNVIGEDMDLDNTIKANFNKRKNSKQSDLEDFLSNKSGDNFSLKTKENMADTVSSDANNEFFIPKEQVIPDNKLGKAPDPFKEADILNASSGIKDNSKDELVPNTTSLISKLSNVKERAINVGTKAFSLASELANKSLETKFSKREDAIESVDQVLEQEKIDDKIEPTFFVNKENSLDAFSSNIDSNENINIEENITIPSFLRRNKD